MVLKHVIFPLISELYRSIICFQVISTRLAQAGVDLYKISKLLGHKDIKMAQRYAHHCPDSLRDGVEILGPDYNLTTMEKKREVETFFKSKLSLLFVTANVSRFKKSVSHH